MRYSRGTSASQSRRSMTSLRFFFFFRRTDRGAGAGAESSTGWRSGASVASAPRSVRRKKKKKRRDVMLRRDCDALVPREYRIWQIEHIEALRRNRDDPASPIKRAAAPATIAHIEALRAAEDPTSPLRRAAAPAAAPAAPRGFGERFSRGRRLVFGADDEAPANAPAPPPEAPVPPVTATVGFLPA